MSQIGRLLQGGILGGAQAYEDAARLHLAQEQARRDAQFDPVRMQNFQAELEDRRARAERLRRGEAATKQVFEFMRAQRGRNQPGMVGPPAPAVDPFVALPVETLNDADPRVLETVMGDFENEAAATRNVQEVRSRIAGAQQQGLVDFLPKEVWEPGLQMGLIRPGELAKNASFQRENGDKEADKRQALIDLLATRRQADGSLAFDAMSATRFAGMSLPQLEMQAKIMEANDKQAAEQAEQQQLVAQAQQLGIDPQMWLTMTPADRSRYAGERIRPQTPDGLSPSQQLAAQRQALKTEQAAALSEFRAINGQKTDSGTMILGLPKPPPADHFKIAQAMKDQPNGTAYDPPWLGNSKSATQVDVIRASVDAWQRYEAATNSLSSLVQIASPENGYVGQSMPFGGNGSDFAPPVASETDFLERLDDEFVRRYGVEPDPSNPDHRAKSQALFAEMQRAPTGSMP